MGVIAARDPIALERSLHTQFAAGRLRGEWFKPAPELLALIGERATLERPEVNGVAPRPETKREMAQREREEKERAAIAWARAWASGTRGPLPPRPDDWGRTILRIKRRERLAAEGGFASPPRPTVEGMGG